MPERCSPIVLKGYGSEQDVQKIVLQGYSFDEYVLEALYGAWELSGQSANLLKSLAITASSGN